MTKQEEKILEIIKNNPTIEQTEIGSILNIERSTVAVHISNLIKQGYIKGKGYILGDDDYILGIGAANIDVYGKSKIKIRQHYDHPADIYTSVGGVMRNILTNYSLLGGKCKFMSVVGDDEFGKVVINDLKNNGIDTSEVLVCKDDPTGVFLQVQNEDNDMYMALCDMSPLRNITPSYLRKKKNVILNAKLVLLDTSLSLDSLDELLDICEDKVPVYLDPISDNYAYEIRNHISKLTCLKPNKTELEAISSVKINSINDVYKACEKLFSEGLKKIFVSLSKDGILYMDNQGNKMLRKLKEVKKMANASGAGDASMAAIVYAIVNNYPIQTVIDYGLAAGIATIRAQETINKNISLDLLDKIIKEK